MPPLRRETQSLGQQIFFPLNLSMSGKQHSSTFHSQTEKNYIHCPRPRHNNMSQVLTNLDVTATQLILMELKLFNSQIEFIDFQLEIGTEFNFKYYILDETVAAQPN